jgi:hypothetical protein
VIWTPVRAGFVQFCFLEQIEFFCAADSRPAIIHPQLIENVFGVGAQGVQGHDQFAGNFRTAQFGSEKPKHFQFTLAQWLDDY